MCVCVCVCVCVLWYWYVGCVCVCVCVLVGTLQYYPDLGQVFPQLISLSGPQCLWVFRIQELSEELGLKNHA